MKATIEDIKINTVQNVPKIPIRKVQFIPT